MRPIKFRGRIAKDHVENWKHGEIICGSLMVFADDPIDGCTHWIIDEKSKPYRNYPVDEDSIAQLVGYDCDGREVYEGDLFVVPCGTEIAARFIDNLTANSKLKEAQT